MSSRIRIAFPALMAVLIAVACGSNTELVGRWRDPSYTGQPVSSMMVIAAGRSEENRRLFETELAGRLEEHGVRALLGYQVLPTSDFTREEVEAEVKKAGVEAVIVTRLKNIDTTTTYTDPASYTVPQSYYNGYYNYYYQSYQTVVEPAQEQTALTVVLESNLYDVATEKLLWTAVSETFDPKSVSDVVKQVSSAVVEDLKTQGLVRK